MEDRPVQIWKGLTDYFQYQFLRYDHSYDQWMSINFDNLEPGMIVRFDHNDSYIYRVLTYPFLSSKYSPNKDIPVGTIISSEFLYYPENY